MLVALIVLPVLGMAGVSGWMIYQARGRIHSPVTPLERYEVAVVLGTSNRARQGRPNMFFEGRMEAAAELFRRGTVKHLLVSGAVDGPHYNEPEFMTASLRARGVPETAISRDEAGFRTLDSILRARDAFHFSRFLIVSDGWHLPRALYLARQHGIEAEGIASEEVPWHYSFRTRGREWLARVLAVMDAHVLHTQPACSEAAAEEPTLSERLR